MARSETLTPEARRAIDARAGTARQDMALGLASFARPRIRGKRAWLDGVKQQWKGGELTLAGPELDAGDLGVLLALLAIATAQINAQALPSGQRPGLLPAASARPNAAEKADAMSVETTLADVCRKLGRDPKDGRAHVSIRASLKRLAGVVVEAHAGDAWAHTHLISGAAGRGGRVAVALSYRLTRAVMGGGSYSRVDMSAWASLSPTGQVLYHWLCAWRPGGGQCPPIAIDTLARHTWGDDATGAKQRERRQQIREALNQIAGAAGWKVRAGDAPGIALLKAPHAPGCEVLD
jgi:hypothetical protein